MEIRIIKKIILLVTVVTLIPTFSHASVLIRPANYTGVTIKSSDSSKTTKINVSQNDSLTSGLIAYWSFNGPDIDWGAGTAYDRSGNGHDGTLTNMGTSSTPTSGKVGQALNFSEVLDSRVIGPDMEEIDGLATLSVFTWVKPSVLSTDDHIVSKNNACCTPGFAMRTGSTAGVVDEFRVTINGGTHYKQTDSNPLSINEWSYVGFTYDGNQASSNNRINLYVNGVLQTSTTTSGTVGASITGNIYAVNIGSAGDGNANRYFSGIVDEVRVYNRVLSEAEIYQLYKLSR